MMEQDDLQVVISGYLFPDEKASYFFEDDIFIKIPLSLLGNITDAFDELKKIGILEEYSIENDTLHYYCNNHEKKLVENYAEDREKMTDGIYYSLQLLEEIRQEVMNLLGLPNNDEWSVSSGIQGCY